MIKIDIKQANNLALLDELVETYMLKKEYEWRSDYINWSEKTEQEVRDYYYDLYYEALRRMGDDLLS